jgi:hypothetical protein
VSAWLPLTVATASTLALGLWIALAWELRERSRRVLELEPGLFSEPELAYGPFWLALVRAAVLTARAPRVFVPLSAFALALVLSGHAPTSPISDEELAEQEREALRRMRAMLDGDDDEP